MNAKTTAQKIAAMFNDDGQVFDNADGESFVDVCENEKDRWFDSCRGEKDQDWQRCMTKYIFADQSVLVMTDDCWDYGFLDCWCMREGLYNGNHNPQDCSALQDE
jgi:hypothetical protein